MRSEKLCFLLCICALGCGNDESAGTPSGGGAAGGGGSCTTCDAGSGGSGGTSSGGSGGSAGATSCALAADGVAVANVDLDGYPSYVVDGCQLLYVSAASGELVLRDLVTKSESTIAPASESPRRPAFRAGVMAWEADEPGKSVVRVRANGVTQAITGAFDHAGEPRVTGDAVVLTGWAKAEPSSDSDVYLYDLGSQELSLAAGGAGQQRFADVSATHIAVSDFSEDPLGVYAGDGTSLANVIVIERASGNTTVRSFAGKQAFPMLGSEGVLSYLEWLEVHPVPKLQHYWILAVPLTTPAATGNPVAEVTSDQSVRPTSSSGLVEWVVRDDGQNSLWRASLDGSAAPTVIPLPGAEVLHAPSASQLMTVLAVREMLTSEPELMAIPR